MCNIYKQKQETPQDVEKGNFFLIFLLLYTICLSCGIPELQELVIELFAIHQ